MADFCWYRAGESVIRCRARRNFDSCNSVTVTIDLRQLSQWEQYHINHPQSHVEKVVREIFGDIPHVYEVTLPYTAIDWCD